MSDDGRTRLPHRRIALRDKLKFTHGNGDERECEVSFGFDAQGVIREVFCIAAKAGTDMQAIVHDACIATSIALQRGARIGDLGKSFGELREAGQAEGPPASVMGALARAGAALEIELLGGE